MASGRSVRPHPHEEIASHGTTDEDGMGALIEDVDGVPAPDAKAALGVWIDRMETSMVVGQRLREHMGC